MSGKGDGSLLVSIRGQADLVVARRRVRELCAREGMSLVAAEALATAVTEIARNIVVHAGSGELRMGAVSDTHGKGVVVIAEDHGPGIADISQAMSDGYSSGGGGLGLGLPSARRLVDEFEIESIVGKGTRVVLRQRSAKPRE